MIQNYPLIVTVRAMIGPQFLSSLSSVAVTLSNFSRHNLQYSTTRDINILISFFALSKEFSLHLSGINKGQ